MDLGFDVVDLEPPDHPSAGETAPDFTRPLVNEEYWEDVSLSSLADSTPVLLIFYPMDGAFPATYIWNEVRDREWADRFDAQVVGLSISTPYEHASFIEERGIDQPLYSDPSNDIAEAYGIVNDLDGMTGVTEPRPAVFLVDRDRTIEYAWVAEQWPDFPPYDDIEAELD